MITIRCTKKLMDRLPKSLAAAAPPETLALSSLPTNALRDWYATLLFSRAAHFVLAVSERSRLCLILPARPLDTLAARFPEEVAHLLRRIGAAEEEVQQEVQEMVPLTFASTKVVTEAGSSVNRSVLGSINDFVYMVKLELAMDEEDWRRTNDEWRGGDSDRKPSQDYLRDLSRKMSGVPCSPLAVHFPDKTALLLLRGEAIPSRPGAKS